VSAFDTAIAGGLAAIRTAAGVTVTYSRGADSVAVTAVVGRSFHEQADDYGTTVQVQTRDFLIKATDLILASARITPARGDRIVETRGTTEYTHEVIGPGAPDQHYRPSDTAGDTLRIHTNLIGEAAAT